MLPGPCPAPGMNSVLSLSIYLSLSLFDASGDAVDAAIAKFSMPKPHAHAYMHDAHSRVQCYLHAI